MPGPVDRGDPDDDLGDPDDELDDGLRPPFGPAPGPAVDDTTVLVAFARGTSAGHSRRFYAEGPVLLAAGDQPIAIRVAPDTVLVRIDVPDAVARHRRRVLRGLAAAGLALLDEETLWGVPVALQLAGLRLSTWDLWGVDLDRAFAAVRTVASGGEL